MTGLNTEQQENGVRQFLTMAAALTNHSRLELLLSLLENLVTNNVLPARYAIIEKVIKPLSLDIELPTY